MNTLELTSANFQGLILSWFDQHGRKDLPWQQEINPYRVWISETMLQQTQVATVIPYFNTFMTTFPTVEQLAEAPMDHVLQHWSGLGYYARARNVHKTAQKIAELGAFPNSLAELVALPGIGQSTAGAILSIAFNNSHPILDGNVKRVLTRFKAISGWSGESLVNKQLWTISTELTPINRVADYTQAMMDLGATVCKRSQPKCAICPLTDYCLARLNNSVSDYPAPKPRKALPIKTRVFLLLKNDQEILLERRPPAGIWGGLWSVPEFDSIGDALGWCKTKNINVIKQQIQPTQRHTFSHFHLDYTPLIATIKNPANNVMEGNHSVWYKSEQANNLAMATPIKRLLQQLTQEDHDD
jgi:A/G-specific adenine glycosylase